MTRLDHRLDVFVPGCQHLRVTLTQRDLSITGLGALRHGDQRLLIVGELLQYIAHAHVEQAQLPRQVIGVAGVEGFLDVASQPFEVAQVRFDFQAQAQPVLAAQVREEIVDLRVQLETVRAFRHRDQNVEPNPDVQQSW